MRFQKQVQIERSLQLLRHLQQMWSILCQHIKALGIYDPQHKIQEYITTLVIWITSRNDEWFYKATYQNAFVHIALLDFLFFGEQTREYLHQSVGF